MAANKSNNDAFKEAFDNAFTSSFFLTKKAKELAEHVASNKIKNDEQYINRLYNDWYMNLDAPLKHRNIITAREVFINKFTAFLDKYITGTLKKQININHVSQHIHDAIPVKINPLKPKNTNAYANEYADLSPGNAEHRKKIKNAIAKAAKAAEGGRRRYTKKKLTRKNHSRKSK